MKKKNGKVYQNKEDIQIKWIKINNFLKKMNNILNFVLFMKKVGILFKLNLQLLIKEPFMAMIANIYMVASVEE